MRSAHLACNNIKNSLAFFRDLTGYELWLVITEKNTIPIHQNLKIHAYSSA